MSSKRRIRRRSCETKQRFVDHGHAYKILREGIEKGKLTDSHSVYYCRFCSGYHIGRKTKKQIQSMIDKKKGQFN